MGTSSASRTRSDSARYVAKHKRKNNRARRDAKKEHRPSPHTHGETHESVANEFVSEARRLMLASVATNDCRLEDDSVRAWWRGNVCFFNLTLNKYINEYRKQMLTVHIKKNKKDKKARTKKDLFLI